MRLADLPPRCQTPTPHALPVLGQPLEVLVRRGQGQLDKANATQSDCARFYLEQQAQLGYVTIPEN